VVSVSRTCSSLLPQDLSPFSRCTTERFALGHSRAPAETGEPANTDEALLRLLPHIYNQPICGSAGPSPRRLGPVSAPSLGLRSRDTFSHLENL
jgi:hypothetical protein